MPRSGLDDLVAVPADSAPHRPMSRLIRARAPKSQDPLAENFRLHQILVDGYRGLTEREREGGPDHPLLTLAATSL